MAMATTAMSAYSQRSHLAMDAGFTLIATPSGSPRPSRDPTTPGWSATRASVPRLGDRVGRRLGDHGGDRLRRVALTLAPDHGADDEDRPRTEDDRERTDQGEQLQS